MLIKTGVKSDGVQDQVWYALGVFEALYVKHGMQMIVTSLLDGTHMVSSKHYQGLAADLRTRDIPTSTMALIINEAHALLYHLGYDIVLETDHLHIEFDPKPTRDQWLLVHV